jgi:hypothetical protein
MANEFIKENDLIKLNVPYAEIYLPFDIVGDPDKESPVAYWYGDGMRTIGLFNMRFYNSPDDDRDSAKLRELNYPNSIVTYPSDWEIANLKLSEDLDEDKYYILKYNKGDVIMNDLIEQKSQNCERFLNLLIKGKLPSGISYTDLFFSWLKNFKINNVNPGVPSLIMQFIISENCRSKDNPMLQFRKVAGKGNVNPTDYKVYNMVNVASHTSVMAALAFERFGDMLTASLNMTKSGTKQNKSPLERIISM